MIAREVIQRVREIQVHTGRPVADVLAGQYVSVFKGRGIEFEEVRPYIPGDEIRSIDWNVTARMGQPYVKRYVEERQLTLMLMADVSASQDFGSGSRSKREAAAELCALLAFSATRNDDKVGLALFHAEVEKYIPPRKGQKHSLRVVREVLTHGEDEHAAQEHGSWRRLLRRDGSGANHRKSTDISAAMEFFMSVTARRTVCFVVSDFLDQGFIEALQIANRKHDVIAVLLTDPRECELPNVGLVDTLDLESGRRQTFDTGSSTGRQTFARLARARIENLEQSFRSAGIDFIHLDVSRSIVEPLVRFFRMRERRLAR